MFAWMRVLVLGWRWSFIRDGLGNDSESSKRLWPWRWYRVVALEAGVNGDSSIRLQEREHPSLRELRRFRRPNNIGRNLRTSFPCLPPSWPFSPQMSHSETHTSGACGFTRSFQSNELRLGMIWQYSMMQIGSWKWSWTATWKERSGLGVATNIRIKYSGDGRYESPTTRVYWEPNTKPLS